VNTSITTLAFHPEMKAGSGDSGWLHHHTPIWFRHRNTIRFVGPFPDTRLSEATVIVGIIAIPEFPRLWLRKTPSRVDSGLRRVVRIQNLIRVTKSAASVLMQRAMFATGPFFAIKPV